MNMKTSRGRYPGMPDTVYSASAPVYNPNSPTDRVGYGSRKISDMDKDFRHRISPQMFADSPSHKSHRSMGGYSYEPQDPEEVYAAINSRQLTALMFHSEMADLFGFLNLKGFQDMHEHQYLAESACYRALRNFYMTQYGKVLQEDDPEIIEVFPEDWYSYKRSDVTPEIRRQAVQVALEQYLEWEEDTKDCYEHYASLLMSWGKNMDYSKVNKMTQEVSEEIKRIERMHADLKSVQFNLDHIMTTQAKLSRKYDNCYLGKEDMTL